MVVKKENAWTVRETLTHADQEIGLYALLPRYAESYGIAATPVTPEKALACLLFSGDWAMGEAHQAQEQNDSKKQMEMLRLATQSYRYAYLLRDKGVVPEQEQKKIIPSVRPIGKNREPLDRRIKTIIVNVLSVDESDITLHASWERLGVKGLSGGVDLLEILIAVEEEFKITITDEDFIRIETVGELQQYLAQRNVLEK